MRRLRICVAFFAICLVILSVLAVTRSQATVTSGVGEQSPAQKTASQILNGPRFLTSISTDKPIYRINEHVYIRGVVLNALNRKPLPDGQATNAFVQIRGPKGELVASGTPPTENSVWAFGWQVPERQGGGEYTVHATYPANGYTPAERKFDVRTYRAPRLSSQITFLRDGYGPGEKVTATLNVKRTEGGFPEGATVTVDARVDGTALNSPAGKVDAKGICTVSFNLPHEIARGEGTLTLSIQDGGVVESAAKTIPILLQTIDVQMYPEGGDLVAGYKNRVYVQTLQPNGKPADVVGTIVSDNHATTGKHKPAAVQFRTEHEGRGRFEFTPIAKEHYSLKILKPTGIRKLYPLPEIVTQGAVIHADKEIYKKLQPISLQLGCTQKKFRVVVAQRERELASRNFDSTKTLKTGELKDVSLPIPAESAGVLTVTIFGDDEKPLAERLIFREPSKSITIKIQPNKKIYAPGETAKLSIKTTDADGKPVSSVVGVTVTDESVLKMIDKRERAPRLPVMVFLEPEVKDLADASVYLDQKNPKASIATDLLLGTQGWRRFAFVNVEKFAQENGDSGKRVLAFTEPVQRPARGYGTHDNAARAYPAHAYLAHAQAAHGYTPPGAARLQGAAIGAGIGTEVGGSLLKGSVSPLGDDQRRPTSARWNFVPNTWKKENLQMPRGYNAQLRHIDTYGGYGTQIMPRDRNMFQVEPTVIDERRYTSGRSQRHQTTSLALPEGSPIPNYDNGADFTTDEKYMRPRGIPSRNLIMIRQFAHQVRTDRKPSDRIDFVDTLYWNAGVKTDSKTGEAEISFGLNDSVTTFQTFADAFAFDGSIGDAAAALKSIQPFYSEAKLPLEVTAGDHIALPISLINGTDNALKNIKVNVVLPGIFKLMPFSKQQQQINSGERSRWILPIDVGFGKGVSEFVLNAVAGPYKDNVVRQLIVKPSGFPVEKAFGGILEPGKKVMLKITIEKNVVPASVVTNVLVFPSSLAKLTAALERLIQDPSGCFEQTSSTSYPLTMAQQYFLSHANVDPKLIQASREKLDVGYRKLLGYRTTDMGYECFGKDPGHEALTAYGLLHFTDMSKVKDVDQNMIATTRAWLLQQKDGNGGFTRKRASVHTWIEDKDCSNAYIVWAMLESGQSAADLKPEIASLKSAADNSQNSYVVALAANALFLSGDQEGAKKLMARLAEKQKSDGSVDGVTNSIVGSNGEALAIEGTALATLAWLRQPEYAGNVEKSIKYLADSCKSGRYGSTQATILALRSIIAYDKQRARPAAPGKVRLFADGHPIGDWIAFDPNTQESLKLPDLSEILSPGEHDIELTMDEGSAMPYSVAVKYNRVTPTSDKDCKLNLAVKLAQTKVIEGASTEANVTVTNTTDAPIPTPIAIIGLPGGLEPRHDQLKELIKRGTIDAYEISGREVVLYWRTMRSGAKIEIPLSLIAAVPGSYTGPASRAYLYYTDEHKKWVDGVHVEIAAK